MKSLFKFVLPIVMFFAILALAVFGFIQLQKIFKTEQKVEARQTIYTVNQLKVSPQAHTPIQFLYGTLREKNIQTLSAPANGEVDKIFVESGQDVKVGDDLIHMDASDFVLQVELAQASIDETQIELRQLKLDTKSLQNQLENQKQLLALRDRQLKRQQTLFKKEFATQQTVDNAEQTYLVQALVVDGVQDQLNTLKVRESRLKVQADRAQSNMDKALLAQQRSIRKATEDALIVEVLVNEGETMSAGKPLIRLLPKTKFNIEAALINNQALSFLDELNSESGIKAEVSYFDNNLLYELSSVEGDASDGSLMGVFSPVNEALALTTNIRPGVSMRMKLYRPIEQNAVAVPFSALYGRNRIYKIVEGRLRAVQVNYIGKIDPPLAYRQKSENAWALIRSEKILNDTSIMITHLPNAVDGLPVSVQ